jgi:hypothetical protein
MTTRTASLLALLALSVAALTAPGCGSTVTGADGEDGADDGADDGQDGDGDGQDGDGDGDGEDCSDGSWEYECDGCVEEACPEGSQGYCMDGEWLCDCGGDYQNRYCYDGSTEAACIDDRWICHVEYECPDTLPSAGEPCPSEGMQCEYEVEVDCGTGTSTVTVECAEAQWSYVSTPRCQPPLCRDLDQDSCADYGCRWLEPGCGEAPLGEAGCFDATDCVEGSCIMSDEQCMSVSIDPCAGQDCDACSQEVALCVPQLVGE